MLLAGSAYAPELPGVAELIGPKIDARVLAERFRDRLCERLGWRCDSVPFSARDLPVETFQRAKSIESEKFANPAWNFRR